MNIEILQATLYLCVGLLFLLGPVNTKTEYAWTPCIVVLIIRFIGVGFMYLFLSIVIKG